MELFLYLGAIAIMILAQSGVQNKFRKYSQVRAECGLTGADVARKILDDQGLYDIRVELNPNKGTLSDHYDPKAGVIRLSQDVYRKQSIAAVAVAAHEVGHAIQYKEKYGAIGLRNAILPVASVAPNLGWAAIFLGAMSGFDGFIGIGIFLLLIFATFQLITLPIELNASSRALAILRNGFLGQDEIGDAKSMLSAAAFTYIAALISTLANILRVLMMSRRRD